MPFFAYKARNSGGEPVQGVLESTDSGAAASRLIKLDITPIEITPTRAPGGIDTAPSVAGSSPATIFKNVVLPEPFAPTRP